MYGVNYDTDFIRTECVNNHSALLDQAIATLKGKGCVVHMAKTSSEARAIIRELVQPEQKTMKTFGEELEEIRLAEVLPESIQSDLEAYVAEQLGKTWVHPHRAPLDEVAPETISEILQGYYIGEEELPVKTLVSTLRKQIQQQADLCGWGITTADAIVANTGTLIIAEDQGNGRIASNIPFCHIAVVGTDKIYPTNDAAQEAIRASWKNGARKECPTYYSYITGPSRTGDIEGIMVAGMHGPQQVHVILLDNGREDLMAKQANVMKCISCGKCSTALVDALADKEKLPQPLTCKSAALAGLDITGVTFDCPLSITAEDCR